MVAAIDSKSVPVRGGSSSLPLGTRTELNGFFKARRWDARSASHWFPPIFPNEFGFPPSAGRRVFSPRNRCEPKISLAQTFFAKRSESEAILSIFCATSNQFWKGASQSFCVCEKVEISSSRDFFSDNSFDFCKR